MAVASYSDYVSEVAAPYQRLQDTKASLTTVAGRTYSLWPTAPDGGAAPTTAVAPTNTTTGAMGQQDSSSTQYLAQVAASIQNSAYVLICDRLSHQGGLDATSVAAQTTNLPTAALTRKTNGIGVFLGLEIYTQIGTTATTVTASYTNDAGTAGRVTAATAFGGTGFREAGRLIILPLAAGDVGVKAVASVTLALSTGTVGNFGVTLFRPLLALPIPSLGSQQLLFDAIQSSAGNIPSIDNGACLFYALMAGAASTGVMLTANRFIEA